VKNSKSVIITGTHHTPAIELIKQLQIDPDTLWQIHYISHLTPRDTHLTNIIIPKLKDKYHNICSGKFHRRSFFQTLIGIPATIIGFLQSVYLIRRIKPDIVVSFGGYVSVPVIISAALFHIPTITHEQTLTASLSTKINSYVVNKIALSFDDPSQINQLPRRKVVITGNLLRQSIFENHGYTYQKLITDNKPLIYITGGNQGSNFLNQLTIRLIPKLKDNFNIIHQTGNNFSAHHFPGYHPTPFVNVEDIGWVLHHSQIIISRAGANICQELDALNKKAILIPLPFTQQNEQFLNAHWLQQRHPDLIIIIPQLEAKTNIVSQAISRLSNLPFLKSPARKTINIRLLKLIHELT